MRSLLRSPRQASPFPGMSGRGTPRVCSLHSAGSRSTERYCTEAVGKCTVRAAHLHSRLAVDSPGMSPPWACSRCHAHIQPHRFRFFLIGLRYGLLWHTDCSTQVELSSFVVIDVPAQGERPRAARRRFRADIRQAQQAVERGYRSERGIPFCFRHDRSRRRHGGRWTDPVLSGGSAPSGWPEGYALRMRRTAHW